MVLCVKVIRREAERTRRMLIAEGLFDEAHVPQRDGKFVYFAVKRREGNFSFAERRLSKKAKRYHSIREYLAGRLPKKDAERLVTSFDIVGSIAILEIPKGIDEKEVASAVMAVHKNIKTVVKKLGARKGVYRLRKLKVIGGRRSTETIHRENGCVFKLDVAKAYFSPRLVFERRRIAGLVRPGETVLALFSGVGPFPIVIAKFQPRVKIYAIELNPHAFSYMEENVRLNGMQGLITPLKGDVRKILPRKFADYADRILMPLPKGAEGFLRYVFPAARKGCIIHLYSFASSASPFDEKIEKIRQAAKASGRKVRVIGKRIVHPYSPQTVQVVIDFRVA